MLLNPIKQGFPLTYPIPFWYNIYKSTKYERAPQIAAWKPYQGVGIGYSSFGFSCSYAFNLLNAKKGGVVLS